MSKKRYNKEELREMIEMDGMEYILCHHVSPDEFDVDDKLLTDIAMFVALQSKIEKALGIE